MILYFETSSAGVAGVIEFGVIIGHAICARWHTGHTISTILHGLLCEVLLQGVDSVFGVHFDFDCRL